MRVAFHHEENKRKPIFAGFKSPLKTLWKKGQLWNVKRGLYGDILTLENCSLEHLLPISKGGKTELSNLALASKEKNGLRGNLPLKDFLTRKQAVDYVVQFAPHRDFRQYINDLLRTFEKLGVLR